MEACSINKLFTWQLIQRCKEKKEELDALDNWSSKTDSYLFLEEL